MEFNFGGFEVTNSKEAVKFVKSLIEIMRNICSEEITGKNMMVFVGIGASLAGIPDFVKEEKDWEHYKAVLIELLDTYQLKIENTRG